jgi:hypothetical protein
MYGVPVTGATVAKLALAVGDERQLGAGRAGFRITRRAAQIAHKAFGELIIVYHRSPDALLFVGSGRAVGLDYEGPEHDTLRLDDYRAFSMPVMSGRESEAHDPGVRRSILLEQARFDEILGLAAGAEMNAQALAEAAVAFEDDRQAGLDAYLKLHDRVLQRWGYRCAFTGAQFEPSLVRPHPGLRVVAIRPRELGGPLHVRNFLPMTPEVEQAWLHGHITLGPSCGFVVSERLIDPELHERLSPIGKLDLPAEPSRWPDAELVAYHRLHIFDRD